MDLLKTHEPSDRQRQKWSRLGTLPWRTVAPHNVKGFVRPVGYEPLDQQRG